MKTRSERIPHSIGEGKQRHKGSSFPSSPAHCPSSSMLPEFSCSLDSSLCGMGEWTHRSEGKPDRHWSPTQTGEKSEGKKIDIKVHSNRGESCPICLPFLGSFFAPGSRNACPPPVSHEYHLLRACGRNYPRRDHVFHIFLTISATRHARESS